MMNEDQMQRNAQMDLGTSSAKGYVDGVQNAECPPSPPLVHNNGAGDPGGSHALMAGAHAHLSEAPQNRPYGGPVL